MQRPEEETPYQALVNRLKLDFDEILNDSDKDNKIGQVKVFLEYDSHQAVHDALNQFNNRKLKHLKNKIFDIICSKDDIRERAEALFNCLLPNTVIGQIFYKPRYRTVSYTSGTLKKVIEELKNCFEQLNGQNCLPTYPAIRERFNDYPELIVQLESKIPALCGKFHSKGKAPALIMRGFFVAASPDPTRRSLDNYSKGNHEIYGREVVSGARLPLLPSIARGLGSH